ncbi:CSEP0379 putative effector protein [Blumeria hordei DH14]|uniref:CSEP0379 putative effector protein n=1 Tax=Blumeria graminis f. sp. hordei (strain DH14) TaxID=546991 RepID=N1JC28_BLUG1|nr:CSEP0379 putative effector protein [Blumeria hordei DH14]
MKVLSAISACAFTFLLLLGPVMGGNVLKCPSNKRFSLDAAEEHARKARFDRWKSSHPLGADGQKCKAHVFAILVSKESSNITWPKIVAPLTTTGSMNGIIQIGLYVDYITTGWSKHDGFPNKIKWLIKLSRNRE